MASLEKLYEVGAKLTPAEKLGSFSTLSPEYRVVLSGVKSPDPLAKRLASQFIARFFHRFPELANEGLDAMLDLCEDEDVNIRKQAIKDLPNLCREIKQYLPKIVDVLAQLLQSDEKTEVLVIENSIMSLFRRDAKGTLIGLFSQIKNGGDLVRERAIKFLAMKLKIEARLLNKEAEVILLKEIKASINECGPEEFHMFMAMLNRTSIPKSLTGQSQLYEITANMAELDVPFEADDPVKVDKFVQCTKMATEYFSPQIASTKFFKYLCIEVLPKFHSITDMDDQTEILKLLGEAAIFSTELENSLQAIQHIHQKLLNYMPLPPDNAIEAPETPDFELTKVECLLIAFHKVLRQNMEYLTDREERYKDFKARLQYFSRGAQAYHKKLKEFMASKSHLELRKEENQPKVVALNCINNLQSLIRDLFHSPPIFKAKITVSWKSNAPKSALKGSSITAAGTKRQTITFSGDSNTKRAKGSSEASNGSKESGIYKPPTGKYSSVVDTYKEGGRGRGGRSRGRGRWQRGRNFY